MTDWTDDELTRIDRGDEPDLRSQRADRTLRDPITRWVVRHENDPYIRSFLGCQVHSAVRA